MSLGSLLQVGNYDAAEERAMALTCNRIIECCLPYYFGIHGYPTRVSSERALWRYADAMHELRFKSFCTTLLGGLTDEEFNLFRVVNQAVAELGTVYYARRTCARSALVHAFHVLRYVKALFPPGATILEVGPGSGYVGALLRLAGYRYIGTDITQAFYVYANHLMHAVGGGPVLELAVSEHDFVDIIDLAPGEAVHVPWWKYVTPSPCINLDVDAVICNEAMCEMHPTALAYNMKLWADLLARPGRRRAMMVCGWGAHDKRPIWSVTKSLHEHGFVFAHNYSNICVCVQEGAYGSEHAYRLPNPEKTPRRPHDSGMYGEMLGERLFLTPIYTTPSNPWSRQILEAEEAMTRVPRIPFADIETFLHGLMGPRFKLNDDEKFLTYVS